MKAFPSTSRDGVFHDFGRVLPSARTQGMPAKSLLGNSPLADWTLGTDGPSIVAAEHHGKLQTRGKVGGQKVTFTGAAIAEERRRLPGLAFSPAVCRSIWVPMGMVMGVAFTPAGIWLPRSSPIQCHKMHSGVTRQNKPVFSR